MVTTAAAAADREILDGWAGRIGNAPPDPRAAWHQAARDSQRLPPGDWRVLYFQGGRGSGKTRAGAQGLAEIMLSDTEPGGQYGVVAPTYRDAWTVCVEGESGLLAALGTSAGEIKNRTSRVVEYAYRSYGEIGLRNGQVVYVDSADDGALRVQGKNLRAIWGDEIGLWAKWATAWDESIRYAVRKGASKIIVTGTPKVSRPARSLIRRLLRGDEPGTVIRRLRTADNAANLSDAFYRSVIGAARGTRLERQELEGELLDDVANALWTRDLLERCQVPARDGHLFGAVIGVDPSDGAEDSDEQAYTVAGKGPPGEARLYVVDSWGGQLAPAAFARRVLLEAVRWQARVVVEKNHGGAWLRSTFDQVAKDLDASGLIPAGRRPAVQLVSASDAKRTRAEPISALYERGLVAHAGGPFIELEDQLCSYTGARGERSPDRLDSLVWALWPFKDQSFGPPAPAGRRDWAPSAGELWDAAGRDLELPRDPAPALAHRRLAAAHGGAYDRQEGDWSLDGWGPADDPQARPPDAPRRNVFPWR